MLDNGPLRGGQLICRQLFQTQERSRSVSAADQRPAALFAAMTKTEHTVQVTIDGVTYVSHEDPARRGDHNYMARIDLTPFDLANTFEQLWLGEMEGGYEVCCIPFWVYGLALGDLVRKNDRDIIDGILQKSGHRVLRILFAAPGPPLELRAVLADTLTNAGLASEWNGDRHVAIDVPEEAAMQPVFDIVYEEVQSGAAFWEWGDSKEFVTTG
jgi:hypothetical protein